MRISFSVAGLLLAGSLALSAQDKPKTKVIVEDGKELTVTGCVARNPDGTHPFRQPHYMILNLALGGDNGGPVDGTEFPARFEVDWVRVYQERPSATPPSASLSE